MATDSAGGINSSDIHLETASKTKDELLLENAELQRKAKNANRFALVLGILALVALGIVVGLLINLGIQGDTPDETSKLKSCGTVPSGQRKDLDLLGEPDQPGPFHDITSEEIKKVRQFLEEDIRIVKPEAAKLSDPYIYTIDLKAPNKTEALAYLDNKADPPPRFARVILFRGDLTPQVVEERICGPLDNITSCVVDVTVPFAKRPIEFREYTLYDEYLIPEIQRLFGTILQESYGGSFDYDECEDDCLNYYNYAIDIGNTGEKRKTWLVAMYDIPYYGLYALDFGVFCNVDGVDETKFSVEKVWYSGMLYNSPQELLDAYNNGTANRTQISYPTEEETMFSTLKHRGPYKPTQPRRPPELVEPDGKRYTVRHRKVEYLDMWSFYYRMSPISGPALYDVRFLGERIAYEISLAELGVFYSSSNPSLRQAFIVDSAFIIGSRAKALVAGADCPTSATFLPLTVTSQGREEPVVFPRAICIFEQNLGKPLRRHHSYSLDEGAFFGGMLDSALIVRSIHTVDNYDYVIDFMFHQNGAMGASIGQTGYILSSFYTHEESPYGIRITDHMFGPAHMHVASFKVDIDINGTSNRYETMDLEGETTMSSQMPNVEETVTKFSYDVKSTEQEAAYVYDFDKPMYHIFHNNDARNKYGERKSFRLTSSGLAKQLLQKNVGRENVMPWARYQLAVTRHKDQERTSSSPYAQWGQTGLPTNFQNYIDDNEALVDEDLVVWVTLADHHIPHSEDLPVVATAGQHKGFHLLPYNYFPECPSMMSRDAVYVARADQEKPEEGLVFDYYGTGDISEFEDEGRCEYEPPDTSEPWKNDPDALFETTENNGVL